MSKYQHISFDELNGEHRHLMVGRKPLPGPGVSTAGTHTQRGVLLHHDKGTIAGNIAHMGTAPVAYHVIIDRDGTRWQTTPYDRIAWHAGEAAWPGRPDWNWVNQHALGVCFLVRLERDKDLQPKYDLTNDQVASFAEWWAEMAPKRQWDTKTDLTDHRTVRELYRDLNGRHSAAVKVDLYPGQLDRVRAALSKATAPPAEREEGDAKTKKSTQKA